jgi:hypothetical protein
VNKNKQKILFFFFCGIFILSAGFCFAKLEATYPPLIDGRTLASDTPLPEYLKYVFDMGMAIGFAAVFYSLAYAGVLYLLSPALPNTQSMAKDRVEGALSGMLILIFTYLMLVTINPQLAFFKGDPLTPIPPPQDQGKSAGVYFYENNNCSGDEAQAQISNINDLGDLRNKVSSIKIVNKVDQEYIAIAYDLIGLSGKCKEIDSGVPCDSKSIAAWPTSASIHKYDYTPEGDGVYIYYNSFFNKEGGYYKIFNSDIDPYNIYSERLEDLRFTGTSNTDCTVPKDKQKCIAWDDKNNCTQRECPNLAEKNISSIEIKGNYIVLLVYFGPGDETFGPWTFCQEFPAPSDVNKTGPTQIKWENILNNGKLPNYILIYPIKP